MDELTQKTVVMLVGPSAIGKSTLMNEVVKLDKDFGRVSSFTTRKPRSNDEPGTYRYISEQEAHTLIAQNLAVQHAVFPTTGDIYGSEIDDYPARYNLLDTLSNAVSELRELPFKRNVTISLTADPSQWQRWFLSRYPEPSEQAHKRLEEAVLSIRWSQNDNATFWLQTEDGKLDQAASRLIDIVHGQSIDQAIRQYPEAMLALIEKGMWS